MDDGGWTDGGILTPSLDVPQSLKGFIWLYHKTGAHAHFGAN